jgi:predicted enzyme related to lactoylglutathione lyase
MTRAVFFEIPVVDLPRAMDFYGHVFGVAFQITTIDGNEMAFFPDVAGDDGASGALAQGESYVPALDGTRVYLAVQSIEATLQRVIEKGGEELYPKTRIGELGFVAEFQDCEGNRIAVHAEP